MSNHSTKPQMHFFCSLLYHNITSKKSASLGFEILWVAGKTAFPRRRSASCKPGAISANRARCSSSAAPSVCACLRVPCIDTRTHSKTRGVMCNRKHQRVSLQRRCPRGTAGVPVQTCGPRRASREQKGKTIKINCPDNLCLGHCMHLG